MCFRTRKSFYNYAVTMNSAIHLNGCQFLVIKLRGLDFTHFCKTFPFSAQRRAVKWMFLQPGSLLTPWWGLTMAMRFINCLLFLCFNFLLVWFCLPDDMFWFPLYLFYDPLPLLYLLQVVLTGLIDTLYDNMPCANKVYNSDPSFNRLIVTCMTLYTMQIKYFQFWNPEKNFTSGRHWLFRTRTPGAADERGGEAVRGGRQVTSV